MADAGPVGDAAAARAADAGGSPQSARPQTDELTDSRVERRWIDAGPTGLEGKRIDFLGLQLTITDVLVRIERLDGAHSTELVHPSRPYIEIPAPRGALATATVFLTQGIEHILFGADHLLFVLGLLLIVRSPWMLVKTISAFTVAHSITLAAATLGYASIPAAAAQRVDRPLDPVPRPGDRPLMARRDELHHPQPMGRRLRLRPPARFRLRQRLDRASACRRATFRLRS